MDKFDDESIREFLRINNLSEDNYFFATKSPLSVDYALFGYASLVNYIVKFDYSKVYFFELSRLSNKNIESCITVNIDEIKEIKEHSFIGITHNIKIVFTNKKTFVLQANKKIKQIEMQSESLNSFIYELKK